MSIPWAQLRLTLLKAFTRFYLEVLAASVLAVLAFGYLWFLQGGLEYLRTQGRYNLLETRTYEQYLGRHLDDLYRLKLQYDQLQVQQFERFAVMLPEEPDYAGLFVQLQALAEASNLLLHGIQLSPNEAAETAAAGGPTDVQSVQMSITVSGGSYDDLKRFLSDIEANLRIFDVTSISFSGTTGGPYALQLRAYFLPR